LLTNRIWVWFVVLGSSALQNHVRLLPLLPKQREQGRLVETHNQRKVLFPCKFEVLWCHPY
jgi:hypothetical protein